jgi:hypothetical protein
MGRKRTTNRKGRLTRGLADDCNDVLTVILGNLEMLKARLTGKEERLLLGEIEKAAKLGAQLWHRSRRESAHDGRASASPGARTDD